MILILIIFSSSGHLLSLGVCLISIFSKTSRPNWAKLGRDDHYKRKRAPHLYKSSSLCRTYCFSFSTNV